MKTIEEIMYNLTGHGVIDALSQVLRENDPEFIEAELRFKAAVELLRERIPVGMTPSLDEYLASHEADIISRTISAGYLGYRVNVENFHHPIGIDFVRLDTIDYLKDHIIGHYKENYAEAKTSEAFLRALPAELHPQRDIISEYYIFMECAGPKLAHYDILDRYYGGVTDGCYQDCCCNRLDFHQRFLRKSVGGYQERIQRRL